MKKRKLNVNTHRILISTFRTNALNDIYESDEALTLEELPWVK